MLAAAAAVGVTRLADVTDLDRLGVPVWQAVRPMSRALSVSQGKGLTPAQARLGAAMESIECACAENWAPKPARARWRDLPFASRSRAFDDFALVRGGGPSRAMLQPWASATRLDGDGPLHVPYDAISLDYTRRSTPGIERGSTGLAAHLTFNAAIRSALHEVVERDAIACWGAGRVLLAHASSRIAAASVPFDWFRAIGERCDAAGISLRIYEVPAVIGLPVFVATLSDSAAADGAHAGVYGAGAHGDPETALRAAVLEAVQTRLTIISGGRDDLLPVARQQHGAADLGALLPTGMILRDFASIAPFGPDDDAAAVTAMVAALARAGFDQTAVVDLAPPGFPVAAVKVVVPGLASATRSRG